MNRFAHLIVFLLAAGAGQAFADESQWMGTWRLIDLAPKRAEAAGQKIQSDADFWVRQEGERLVLHLENPGSDRKLSEPATLSIRPNGPNLDVDLNWSSGTTLRLLGKSDSSTKVQVCLDLADFKIRPKDFVTDSSGEKSTKLVLLFEKHREAVVWVKAPAGAKVSIGEWSQTIARSPLGVRTEALPPNSLTPFDVSIELEHDGRATRDRMRVWANAGAQVPADFSDVTSPDVAVRTYRYWECCSRHLHVGMSKAQSKAAGKDRDAELRQLFSRIATTPVRGVDPDAIQAWQSFSRVMEESLNYQKSAVGIGYLVESFARGAQGDPFGATVDRMNELERRSNACATAFQTIKELSSKLTLRYDTEFSIP